MIELGLRCEKKYNIKRTEKTQEYLFFNRDNVQNY